jgi:hypothetical protein
MIPGTVPSGYAGPAIPMTIWTTQRTGGRNTTCRNTTSFRGRTDIEAKSPDAFVLDQVHTGIRAVAASVRQIADSRTKPPEAIEDVLTQLERDGLVESVTALRAA